MSKKILFAIVACLTMLSLNIQAQDNREKKQRPTPEQMAQRTAQRIAGELKLDDATADKFVKTYIEYSAEKGKVFHKYMGDKKPGDKQEYKSDAQIEKEILNKFAMSRAIIDVRQDYFKKFRKFLTPRQVQYIYSKERDNAQHMKREKNNRDNKKWGGDQRKHDGPRKRDGQHRGQVTPCKEN